MAQSGTPLWVSQSEILSLPRLPIPPLAETLKRYEEYTAPLLSPEEAKAAHEELVKFGETQAPLLDQGLRELQSSAKTSWLEGMWDTAYLEYRERSAINVNPAFMLNDDPTCNPKQPSHQLDRAARLLESTAKFALALRHGSMAPDKEGQNPICMHQYTKLLGASRIPISGRDILVQNHSSKHVIVLIKRQYYILDIIDQNNEPIPAGLLNCQLQILQNDALANTASDHPTIPNVSVLTSEHRDTWADVYIELERLNPTSVQQLHDAILVLVLDQNAPATNTAAGLATLHNLGEDRWFDKSLQLIVYKNSITGVNMEHAGFDGQTLVRWFSDIAELALKTKSIPQDAGDYRINKLKWALNEKIHVAIGRAQRDFEEFCHTMDMNAVTFTKFGKRSIVKHKVSPDAFVQMAFHLAYFRTFGTNRSAYESCSMKRFYHGRTECLRSLTPALKHFIDLTRCPPSTGEQQQAAARKAFDAHTNRAKQCQQGAGVDRHMWGMYQLAIHRRQLVAGYQIPKIYSQPGWKRMRHDHLSTSNCGTEMLSLFGFGPTWSDGLGLGYIIKNNQILVCVTSFEKSANRYAAELEKAFEELLALFEENRPLRTLQAKL